MQVDKKLAPARFSLDGQDHYFCSDHCRERFERDPRRYLVSAAGKVRPETG